MSQRELKRLPVSSLNEMIDSGFSFQGVKPYICNDFGIVAGIDTYPSIKEMFRTATPYRVDDYRFILFREGDFEVTANLRNYHIMGNTLGIMGSGGIIQIDKINQPVRISGLLVKEDFLRLAMGGKLPAFFKGGQHNNFISVSLDNRTMIESMINLLRAMVEDPTYSREAVSSLIAAIVNCYSSLFERHGEAIPQGQSRQQRVLERFIDLVNEHCSTHHTLDFYADRLCITQRYLGTLVHQASGSTAKEWIDCAIINEAKVALRHSDVTVAQLADSLNFPNPAFFTKFFKRMTGMTPTQYRR